LNNIEGKDTIKYVVGKFGGELGSLADTYNDVYVDVQDLLILLAH